MARLIVPRANERQRTLFKRFNITLIDSISEQEFEEAVIEYLNHHNMLHLATCRDNEVRSTPLEYFNNGLTVYISSEGGGKFANLKVNPNVSYSISDPYEPEKDFFGAIGLQVWGIASTFKKSDNLQKYEEIRKYRRQGDALKKQGIEQLARERNFNMITIEPVKIRYLNLKKGFRNIKWEREG
jgi:general stress protein 26